MTQDTGDRREPLFLSEADVRDVLQAYGTTASYEPLAAQHVELLLTCLQKQLWLAPAEGQGGLGSTRTGGTPDMASSASWPLRAAMPERAQAARERKWAGLWIARQLAEDVPFEFIAQVDLAEVAGVLGEVDQRPSSGRLLFFLDMAVLMDRSDGDDRASLVVHDASPLENLVTLEVPAKFDDMESWWHTPDPAQAQHYEAMANDLDAQGQREAAQAMRDLAANADHDTSKKPFVYPRLAKRLMPLLVLPDKSALEFGTNPELSAFAHDDETSDCYELLTANDIGPFTADPNGFRVTQSWLMREARRVRMMGPPGPEQSDPRYAAVDRAERPAYPWDSAASAEMTRKASKWRLLLQVSIADLSQQSSEGTVYFMVHEDDLGKADFTNAQVVYQQT